MKRIMAAVAAVGLVTLFGGLTIFGPAKLWTLMRATVSHAEATVDANLPDEQVEAVIRVKVKDLDAQIRTYHDIVGKLEDRYAAAQAVVSEKQRAIEGHKILLKRAKELLDQSRSSYEIAGKTVTKEQLATDAQARIASCEQIGQQIECQRKLAQQLKQTVEEGVRSRNVMMPEEVFIGFQVQLDAIAGPAGTMLMEIRVHGKPEAPVKGIEPMLAEINQRLQSQPQEWLQSLQKNPAGFADLEKKVHHVFQQMADQLVAGLLAQATQGDNFADNAKKK